MHGGKPKSGVIEIIVPPARENSVSFEANNLTVRPPLIGIAVIYFTCPCCRGRGYLIPKPDIALVTDTIADSIGEEPFTVDQLFRHAEFDEALRTALVGRSRKQLGRLLLQNIDTDFDGYCIEPCGKEHGSRLWKLSLRRV
ncbi:hypothetical protein GWG65_03500 [Bradyrhizobium sp. CSA207]|uniref:hypothetical protein n=1 Tax=Bradyrhizobium sp. CSA207 TaxID=2698826 RepID=UPI0023B1ED23|nr:hypothetical protein [Bradyrhizobium sp. CSA207]MDE5440529.1 hypothetical protein [Bradyrhizobium sp. CSA207]